MEKQPEWQSSNVAIKIMVKQQNWRSGCLILTLKQEDHAHVSKSESFIAKNSHNNRGSGKNVQLLDWCAWDRREEGGEENNFCIVSLPLSASQNWQASLCHRPFTTGCSHKPIVMRAFTTGFWPSSVIFWFWSSEPAVKSISLSVIQKLVSVESVAVGGAFAYWLVAVGLLDDMWLHQIIEKTASGGVYYLAIAD